jgi:enoyl-CoA hydratase/carnithine racemase
MSGPSTGGPGLGLVQLERAGDIASITVGTGQRGNALSTAGWRELASVARELVGDSEVRAVVIRGHGGTFSSGYDLRDWAVASPDAVSDSFAAMEDAFSSIERIPAPVVAEVAGVATGAGCQLALAADIRIMAANARIGMPIARFGIIVSVPFAARIVAQAGPELARELLYTGRLLSAQEAVERGLVSRCVGADDLANATRRLVGDIAIQPPAAVRAAKQAIREAFAFQMSRALAPMAGSVVTSFDEFRSGVRKFLQ